MKQWVKKLIEQFEVDGDGPGAARAGSPVLSEEKATLVYILDLYNKHLVDFDAHPVRKVREKLDEFAKGLMQADQKETDRLLFELRQWFASYRLDEATYIQNTFDDFKRIIWDFADQLSDEVKEEKAQDKLVTTSLEALREAVESNSIDALRSKSREFISFYIEHQSKKDERRHKRMHTVRRTLDSVKKQLVEANQSLSVDHLTQAFNRRSFDERLKNQWRLFGVDKAPCTLVILDIDHFKKVNDTYGHDIGDFVLKECVRLLQQSFNHPDHFVSRIGGEEFAVILPNTEIPEAVRQCEQALENVRKEVFVQGGAQIRFTVSMGLAALAEGESWDQWMKRADTALYQSKNSGRNRLTVAAPLAAAA